MTGAAFDRVVQAFEAAGLAVTVRGGGRASAQAPGHSAADRSVSISDMDLRTVIHPHAGEPAEDILAAVGLTYADLWNEPITRLNYPDGRVVLREPRRDTVVDGKRQKAIQQRNAKGKNALYRSDRLAQVPADMVVYVPEGEPDVHAIESAGGIAVTSAMGAGKAHLFDWTPLQGRTVIVVADNDPDGQGDRHARQVAERLNGIAASVRIVRAKTGKDATDHLAAGHTLTDFVPVKNTATTRPHCTEHADYRRDCAACIAELESRIRILEVLKGEHSEAESPNLLDGARDGQWLDSQEFPPLAWAVPGVLPEGFGLVVAPPKAGKSWLVAGIGLACAAGGIALGRIHVDKRPCLYLALEDGHRRLQSRFRMLTQGEAIPAGISVLIKCEQNLVIPTIAEFMLRHRSAAPLVILDTLGKARPPKQRGEDSYAADYAIGTQLKNVADSVPGGSLLVVHHTRKAESTDFVDMVSGTQGIAGSADFVLVLNRKRKSDQAILSVTGRDVPENEYALVIDEGRWSLDGMDLMDAAATVETRQEDQQRDKLSDRSMAALAFVARRPLGTRASDLAEHLKVERDDAGKYLRRLHDKGLIAKRPGNKGIFVPLSTDTRTGDEDEVSAPEEGDDQQELPVHGHTDTADTTSTESTADTSAHPTVRSVRVSVGNQTTSSGNESGTDTGDSDSVRVSATPLSVYRSQGGPTHRRRSRNRRRTTGESA